MEYLLIIIGLITLFMRTANSTSPQTMPFMNRLRVFIEKHEGTKLNAYQDQAGHWTIGIGHKILPHENWMIGGMIGESKVLELFEQDIQVALDAINKHVRVQITDNQRIALASFIFNLGVSAFANSTLLKRLNSGEDKLKVAMEFDRWVNIRINGQLTPAKGLISRRLDEKNLFIKPN